MAPSSNDGNSRKKSINPFNRSSSTASNRTVDPDAPRDGEKKERKKLSKRNSIFHLATTANMESRTESDAAARPAERAQSPSIKSRALHRGRPGSVFGSLGRNSVNNAEDDADAKTGTSSPQSPDDGGPILERGSSKSAMSVLHHGEVQTASGLFRKKKEYMVLTETHLIRFKTQSRASEYFPAIQNSFGRGQRHHSTVSISSLQDVQSIKSHVSIENDHAIPLTQIVTAYRVEDGRPFYTLDVVWLDEDSHGPGSIQMILHDPKEADLWHTSIRAAAQKARLLARQPFPNRVVTFLVNELEAAQDYDVDHFHVFRVVRRSFTKMSGRSSADDLSKLGSVACYLVIGLTRLHLIALPDFSEVALRAPANKSLRTSYGIVSLVAMDAEHLNDAFNIGFRSPLQPPAVLELAASSAPEIVSLIFASVLYLKPQWLEYTFLFGGHKSLLEMDQVAARCDYEDNGCFDRTLTSYCNAYGSNPGNIRYTIDYESEIAPEFRLLSPASTPRYTAQELLAVMRSLRYNESFRSISFNGIDLHAIHNIVDTHGADHLVSSTRSGIDIRKYFKMDATGKSLLFQEIQAIALKSVRLRKLDFGDSLPHRRPRDGLEDDFDKDPGCEYISALLPLCRENLTNVDSIVLSGIELGETDLEEFVPALETRRTSLRSLDIARCALGNRGMEVMTSKLEHQNATLEQLNISDNPGRLTLGNFAVSMSRFSKIRVLDISRVSITPGEATLITPQVMLSWRLEQLILTGVLINKSTLETISTYLASEASDSLHLLQMDQCNLTGHHVALLMRTMSRKPGKARDLHLQISANRLEKGNSEIVKAIEASYGPSQLTMRLVDYLKESRFRELLQALRKNTTIRSLDISKASLPYDAGPETCEALRLLFAENTTLEELDISGEQAHLEITRFGIGLSQALTGLINNKALRFLRIEYQNLGLEGANALSSVLETNETLTHIWCDRNEISLQGFTTLVNALEHNFTVVEMPYMVDDQAEAVKRMIGSLDTLSHLVSVSPNPMTMGTGSNHSNTTAAAEAAGTAAGGVKQSVRRKFTSFGVGNGSSGSNKEKHGVDGAAAAPTMQEMNEAVAVLNQKWQKQVDRLQGYLVRNQNIAFGLEEKASYLGGGGAASSAAAVGNFSRPTKVVGESGPVAAEHSFDIKNNDGDAAPRVNVASRSDEDNDSLRGGIGWLDLGAGNGGGDENERLVPAAQAGQ